MRSLCLCSLRARKVQGGGSFSTERCHATGRPHRTHWRETLLPSVQQIPLHYLLPVGFERDQHLEATEMFLVPRPCSQVQSKARYQVVRRVNGL